MIAAAIRIAAPWIALAIGATFVGAAIAVWIA